MLRGRKGGDHSRGAVRGGLQIRLSAVLRHQDAALHLQKMRKHADMLAQLEKFPPYYVRIMPATQFQRVQEQAYLKVDKEAVPSNGSSVPSCCLLRKPNTVGSQAPPKIKT